MVLMKYKYPANYVKEVEQMKVLNAGKFLIFRVYKKFPAYPSTPTLKFPLHSIFIESNAIQVQGQEKMETVYPVVWDSDLIPLDKLSKTMLKKKKNILETTKVEAAKVENEKVQMEKPTKKKQDKKRRNYNKNKNYGKGPPIEQFGKRNSNYGKKKNQQQKEFLKKWKTELWPLQQHLFEQAKSQYQAAYVTSIASYTRQEEITQQSNYKWKKKKTTTKRRRIHNQ